MKYKGYLSMVDLDNASPGSTYIPKKGRGNKVINSARKTDDLRKMDMPVERFTVVQPLRADNCVWVRFDSGLEATIRWRDVCRHYHLEQTTRDLKRIHAQWRAKGWVIPASWEEA
jgi:hypothetical protein